jgi:hypothetical protein
MRISLIVPVLNGFEIAERTLQFAIGNLAEPKECHLIIIDNGSDTPFLDYLNKTLTVRKLAETLGEMTVIRNETNVGNYPIFFQALEVAKGEVMAFIHSDVFIYKQGWDNDVCSVFYANSNLGLVGFIGSTEMDNFGGRGSGTRSNFQGMTVDKWTGSKAEIHGKRDEGFIIDGSVIDGCVMIFRKAIMQDIERKKDFPIHHHYDRLFSAQMIEKGFKVGILGIPFDHISGATANTQDKYQSVAKQWFKEHMGIDRPEQWAEKRAEWLKKTSNPSCGKIPNQYDHCTYLEAEYQFLKEYRDEKHIVPALNGKPQLR